MPRKTRKKTKKEYIKEDYMDDGILRVPRPLGFTYTVIQSKKQGKDMDKLIDKTIQLYINNNMHWNGKQTPIQEMASYLNMNTQTLLMKANREVERISNFFDGSEGQRFARVQFFNMVKKGLEIQALVSHQTQILMAQQGNEYVPFLTGEVNRSLTNLINAQKPMQELIKMLGEKNAINILINMDKQSETSGAHYLSPEQAMKMIQEQPSSLLGNAYLIEQKEAELGELPDVTARNQDLSKIGVKIPKKNITENLSIGNANIHDNRPSRVPNQVDEADDFIA